MAYRLRAAVCIPGRGHYDLLWDPGEAGGMGGSWWMIICLRFLCNDLMLGTIFSCIWY